MAGNRFFTILVIPERTAHVRRIVVPAWLFRGTLIASLFAAVLGGIMVIDYWYVMSQISENRELKLENRRLRQQVQVFRNKMDTIEATMDRVKTFATRLKVITNIEDRGNLIQSLNRPLPDAASNITTPPADIDQLERLANPGSSEAPSAGAAPAVTTAPPPQVSSPAVGAYGLQAEEEESPLSTSFLRETEALDSRFSLLNYETLLVEQILQDQYELLADQKAFLAALPTRKPAVGYFTSGFGVRRSPFGGKVKMHEGLDIANHPGTPIYATADGVVIYADSKSGYGQTVIIDHGYGLETWYGHTRKILVSKGEKIRRGDTIALLGNSGMSTGPHLHYEVRVNGTPVDPLSYILEN